MTRRYFLVDDTLALTKADLGKYAIFRQKRIKIAEIIASPFINCLQHQGLIGRLKELGLDVTLASHMKPAKLKLDHGDVLYVITSLNKDFELFKDADTLPESMSITISRITINVPGAKDEENIETEMEPHNIANADEPTHEALVPKQDRLEPSKVFFTADTHFFDSNILQYRPRFKSVEQMNRVLVENWNSKVPEDGIVFHLGDFGKGGAAQIHRFLKRLNGKIILIPGNHDDVGMFSADTDKVRIGNLITKCRFQGKYRTLMCHFPFLCYSGEQVRSLWQLYGHVHSGGEDTHGMDLPRLKFSFPTQYDVGVDSNDFSPISFFELKRIMKDRCFRYDHYTNLGYTHEETMEIIANKRVKEEQKAEEASEH